MASDRQADYDSDQRHLIHRLPAAPLVDRIPFLLNRCRDQRVIHVGFADTGYRDQNRRAGRWLHEHLDEVASSLVGIDLDAEGVEEASADGYEVYLADCTDADALRGIGIEGATRVVAGEIIEHLDAPGPFLEALKVLTGQDGQLLLTTPNACGWVNPLAALVGYEVNHPDHLVMFTYRTLTALLERHGWEVVEFNVFVPQVNAVDGGVRLRLLGAAARLLVTIQRVVARIRPFTADGLVVVARPRLP